MVYISVIFKTMATPEGRIARYDAEAAERYAIESMHNKIVRAQTWSQHFATVEEAEGDFLKNIVGTTRQEFEGNHTLQEYRIKPHPEGNIHIFVHNDGYSSRYQRLPSGDVSLEFCPPGEPTHRDLIVATVGNINHPFTISTTVGPDVQVVLDLLKQLGTPRYEEVRTTIGTDPHNLIVYIKGKPAMAAWEDLMLTNGYLPQRIGHRIFPHFILEAQTRFASAYPDLMPK